MTDAFEKSTLCSHSGLGSHCGRLRLLSLLSHHRPGHDVISNSPGSYKALLDFHQWLANPFSCCSECRRATRSSWVPKGMSHFAPMQSATIDVLRSGRPITGKSILNPGESTTSRGITIQLLVRLISCTPRNQASLLAFTIPPNWRPGTGVSIVATHVDSPNLRVSRIKCQLWLSNIPCTRFVLYQRRPTLDISKLALKLTVEESGTRGLTAICLWQDGSSSPTETVLSSQN